MNPFVIERSLTCISKHQESMSSPDTENRKGVNTHGACIGTDQPQPLCTSGATKADHRSASCSFLSSLMFPFPHLLCFCLIQAVLKDSLHGGVFLFTLHEERHNAITWHKGLGGAHKFFPASLNQAASSAFCSHYINKSLSFSKRSWILKLGDPMVFFI